MLCGDPPCTYMPTLSRRPEWHESGRAAFDAADANPSQPSRTEKTLGRNQAGPHRFLNHVACQLAQQPAVLLRRRRRTYPRDYPIMAVGRDCGPVPQDAGVEIFAIANCADAAPDHIAQRGHSTIGGGEVFEAVPRNTAMNADLSVVIARNPLPFCIRAACVLTKTGPATQLPASWRMVITDLHGVRVIQRDRPGRGQGTIDRVALRHGIGVGRELVDVGKYKIGDTNPNPVTFSASVGVDHANRRLHPVPLAQLLEIDGKS